MRRLGDYVGDMRTRRLLDREIERLLAGAPMENRDLALLSTLVEDLRSSVDHLPSEAQVRHVAARAATVVLERSQHLTDPEVSHRRRQMVGLSPRLAAVILAVLMVPAMTGVALAADSAIPGEALYGLDRALEAVGVGAGSTEERLDEAEMLAAAGKTDEALDHAIVALAEGAEASDLMARQALEAIANQTLGFELDRSALIALLAYVSENAGDELGADGREFGQAVAALARQVGSSASAPNSPSNVDPGQGEGPPVEPGNGNGQPGQGEGAQDPNQGNQGSQGDGQASGNQGNENQGSQGGQGGEANGSQGNPNGNGDQGPPNEEVGGSPEEASPEDGPSGGEATTESDPVAPGPGGDDADDDVHGNEQGPKPDSPSVTAPGHQGKS